MKCLQIYLTVNYVLELLQLTLTKSKICNFLGIWKLLRRFKWLRGWNCVAYMKKICLTYISKKLILYSSILILILILIRSRIFVSLFINVSNTNLEILFDFVDMIFLVFNQKLSWNDSFSICFRNKVRDNCYRSNYQFWIEFAVLHLLLSYFKLLYIFFKHLLIYIGNEFWRNFLNLWIVF